MTDDITPARAAADWFLYLREDPDDEDLKRRFAQWLDSDPAHARAWADMTVTASVMAAIPQAPCAPSDAIVGAGGHARRRIPARRFMPVCGLALAATFAAMMFLPPDMLARMRADQYAPVATTRNVLLADGSEVTLAPRSAISVTMTASGRHVRLIQGEALFNVRHDPARPFRVTAGDVTATDIGTVFDVRADADATTVAVREGAVHVTTRHRGIPARDLHAGDWEQVTGERATDMSGTMPVAAIGAWREGTLIARNDTVATLIARLRPWTTTRIILTDPVLAQKRVTGTYDLHQPEASLRLIVDAYNGKVSSLASWIDLVTTR